MAFRLGDTAPDFTAETTDGTINFHEWLGDSWGVLFSHPKDFTPVCTTELGYMAKIKPEFEKRNVKIIGLSVDPSDRHQAWAADIEETQGAAPNYPIIADSDFAVSKLYDMLPAEVSGDPLARTPADNQTVRNVYVVGPDKKLKLILVYPMTTGRNFDEVLRVIDSLQLTAKHRVATPVNWKQGEDVIIAGSVSDDEAKTIYPDGWKAPKPYIRIVPQPAWRGARHPNQSQLASTHCPDGRGQAIEVGGRIRPHHRRADRYVNPLSVDDDWLGAQAPSQLADVRVTRAHDVRAILERPVGAEEVDPALPERLVAEVGRQVVDDLDHFDLRVQLGQPARAERARCGVGRAAVDEHGEPLAPPLGFLDQVRMTEVRRVEPPDDQAGGHGARCLGQHHGREIALGEVAGPARLHHHHGKPTHAVERRLVPEPPGAVGRPSCSAHDHRVDDTPPSGRERRRLSRRLGHRPLVQALRDGDEHDVAHARRQRRQRVQPSPAAPDVAGPVAGQDAGQPGDGRDRSSWRRARARPARRPRWPPSTSPATARARALALRPNGKSSTSTCSMAAMAPSASPVWQRPSVSST